MRFWLLGFVSLALVVGLSLPSAAQDLDATKIITVRELDSSPGDLSIKTGDTIRWEWESGSHTILVQKPAPDADPVTFLEFALNSEKQDHEFRFDEEGTFFYFAQGQRETISGTITVLEATPVKRSTWGRIKNLFESP
jgi:plastocyanin